MTVADGGPSRATHEAFFMVLLYKMGWWDGESADISYGNHRFIIEPSIIRGELRMWEGTLRNPKQYEHIL